MKRQRAWKGKTAITSSSSDSDEAGTSSRRIIDEITAEATTSAKALEEEMQRKLG